MSLAHSSGLHSALCCSLYRGEWQGNKMHGCGVKLQKDKQGRFAELAGQFVDDEFAGPSMSCSTDASRQIASEADTAAAMARAFQVGSSCAATLTAVG